MIDRYEYVIAKNAYAMLIPHRYKVSDLLIPGISKVERKVFLEYSIYREYTFALDDYRKHHRT